MSTATRALAVYIDAVDKHIVEYSSHPVERSGCELKFVKYCAYREYDAAEVANLLARVRAGDENMPVHLLWLSGAWDYICYNQ